MSVTLVLLGAPLPSCVRDDASHCANNDGDASCAGLGIGLDYCSRCTSNADGCVAEPPGGDCGMAAAASSVDAGTSQATSMTGVVTDASTGAMTMSSSVSSPVSSTTVDSSTLPSTSVGESESESGDGTVCGDGVKDDDEQCDGMDLGQFECSSGTLSCRDDCTLDDSACSEPGCGNRKLDDDEPCEGTDFGGKTCDDQLPNTIGQLVCVSCMIDYSQCCLPENSECENDSQCCDRLECSGVPPLVPKACHPPLL